MSFGRSWCQVKTDRPDWIKNLGGGPLGKRSRAERLLSRWRSLEWIERLFLLAIAAVLLVLSAYFLVRAVHINIRIEWRDNPAPWDTEI